MHYGWFFGLVLKRNFAFYRKIGTRRMSVRNLEVSPIDEKHDMVKVHYRADYLKDGREIRIDFDVTYLLEKRGAQPQIFAFVSGDEMQAYKDAGLV